MKATGMTLFYRSERHGGGPVTSLVSRGRAADLCSSKCAAPGRNAARLDAPFCLPRPVTVLLRSSFPSSLASARPDRFSDTSSVLCAQDLELTPAQLNKGDPIPLRLVKFNNVDVLSSKSYHTRGPTAAHKSPLIVRRWK